MSCSGLCKFASPDSNAIILKTENSFSKLLFNFCNLPQILNILKKKMVVIGNVFPKLQSVKDLVRTLSKKRCLGISFHTQHVKGSQTIVTSVLGHFYHIFSSFWGKMVWKISPLLKFEICGLFLTHWLPMTSILFGIVRICSFLFKCNYLKNKKFFGIFYFIYGIYIKFKIFLKKRWLS